MKSGIYDGLRWAASNEMIRKVITPVRMLRDLVCAYLRIPIVAHPGRAPSKLLRSIVGLTIQRLHGPSEIEAGPDEAIVVCRVKDGEEYIKAFIQHHLDLGVKHVVLLDNGSADNTVAFACQYDSVTVLRSRLPFRTYSRTFLAFLREQYSKNCWCLCLDIDEFFDYPYSDKVTLRALLKYLNERSYNLVLANMLEMFADEPFSRLESLEFSRELYSHYDLSRLKHRNFPSDLKDMVDPGVRQYIGGVRRVVFRRSGPLHKYPLCFLGPELSCVDIGYHEVLGGRAKIADLSGVLFHYQFTGSLRSKCLSAAREKQYFVASEKYGRFLEVLNAEPDLNIRHKARDPREFRETNELLDAGFLYGSEAYLEYAIEFPNAVLGVDER